MATRAIASQTTFGPGSLVIVWTGLLNGDDGSPTQLPFAGDLTIEAAGTFGAGGSMALEGTNDPTATSASPFGSLTAKGGTTALAITAAGIRTSNETPLMVRPRVTAGDGTTSLTARLVVKRLERQA